MNTQLRIALADEAATAALMADLAMLVGAGDIITLAGDLGAGKSTAARAVIRYLAGDVTLDVPSPTFTLVQSYALPPFPVLHADLYRINDVAELDELGLSPWPDDSLTLIEWPERASAALPADRIAIALAHDPTQGDTSRIASITGHGASRVKVERLGALRRFLDEAGYGAALRARMAGDASTRSYARLAHGGRSTILMNAPRRPDGPALYNGKSYSAAVHLAEDVTPFIAMAGGLRAQGLSAPAIHHADRNAGFLITEDFGMTGVVEGDPPRPIPERYHAAARTLAALHAKALPTTLPVADRVTYSIPRFDEDAMLTEVGLMPEWYLPDRGVSLSREALADFELLWRTLLSPILRGPQTWVLRDFHSPNLIWLAGRADDIARTGVIDFQDAVMGPPAYDLVSLAQDARIDVPEVLERALIASYVDARRAADPTFDEAAFAESYAVMSAQRNTRLLGTFARLNRRDGKPHYLRHQPRIWAYLNRSLTHPALAAMQNWFAANVPQP